MSERPERKIEDTQGKYLHAVKNGREITDAGWQQCRVVLTSERIALVGDDRTVVSLEGIDRVGERYDVNQQAATESDYSTLFIDDDVLLVTTADHAAFRTNFYRAMLDGAVIYVKHPAVVGGVVRDSEWQRGRLKVTEAAVRMALEDGQQLTVDRDDIGDLDTGERTVAGEERSVIEVEHTDEEGRSLQTYLSGRERHISALQDLLEEGAREVRADIDLDPVERRVVMALYSGVSPFAISEFVGTDVERVEEIYDRLVELDVIEVVRERTEVSLTARGRRVAGEAMGEQ